MTTIITILGRKGGVGKTTIAKTIADGAALMGYRTLLVDGDGQGNASSGMNIEPHDGFYQLIMQDAEWSDVLVQVPPYHLETDSNLFLLSAWDAQRRVEQYQPQQPGEDTISTRIYNRFAELDGYFDLVVVDTSPGITNVHSAMYYTADYALLPVQCEFDSIQSLNSTISYLHEAQAVGVKQNIPVAEILGIIPNMYDRRESVQVANVGYVRGRYHEYHVFDPISDKTVWKQASQLKVSIYNSESAEGFLERRAQRKAMKEFKPILSAVIQKIEEEVKTNEQ